VQERTSGKDLCPRRPEAGSRSSISTITAQFPLEATCCRRRHGRDPRLRPACDFSLGRSVDWHGVLAEARAQGRPILIRREQGFVEDPDRHLRAASPCLAAATGADRDLAVHVLRRPVLARCLEDDGSQLPCHEVALGPGGLHHAKCISDPWGGHLVEAPLLFVSSIPRGRG
jgi:hypothetical protein